MRSLCVVCESSRSSRGYVTGEGAGERVV